MKKHNLKQLTEKLMQEQAKAIDAFPWDSKEAYADWLAQTYYFVCHSTRLLALAASRFQVDEDAYHLRFLEHLKEEKSHEKLCLTDLKTLGVSIEDISKFVAEQRTNAAAKGFVELITPREEVYPVDDKVAARIGIDHSSPTGNP